ncbi:MAG: acyl-ACP--UDP-N-acetylglucosamine O-acyltransferase [Chitinophagales bacterium]
MNNKLTEIDISPLAHIHHAAKIGKNTYIGAFTFIDKDVVIGDNCWIAPNVTIFAGTRIGNNCRIFPNAVIAAIPQDLKFAGEYTTVEVGDFTTIREGVTINRATSYAWKTVVGSHCLLMAYAHIAHDCILGNHIILANGVNLAGHVTIDDYAILEGIVAVQQFVHIGKHSFVAGGSLVRKDVPPYVKAAREPLSYIGINKIGLERRGFDMKTIQTIHNIYRQLFVKKGSWKVAVDKVVHEFAGYDVQKEILDFISHSQKGIIKGFQSAKTLKNGVRLEK